MNLLSSNSSGALWIGLLFLVAVVVLAILGWKLAKMYREMVGP